MRRLLSALLASAALLVVPLLIPPPGLVATVPCLHLLDRSGGTAAITWNDGTRSVYTATRTPTTVAGQLITVPTGTVVDGPFLGRAVRWVVVSPAPNRPDCLRPGGLTTRPGVSTLTIA